MNLNLSRVIGHSTVITEHHAKEVCNETDFTVDIPTSLLVSALSSGLRSLGLSPT